MRRLLATLAIGLLLPVPARAFTASGRFLYEDRLYDGNGYTGAVQNLPIRRAKVEIVDAVTQTVLATGATDADGRFSLPITGQSLPLNLFARCITDGRTAGYELRVLDNFATGRRSNLAGIEDRSPAGGLGSPNRIFTAFVLATSAIAVGPLAVALRRWRVPLLASGLAFAVCFAWLMPYLSLLGPNGD